MPYHGCCCVIDCNNTWRVSKVKFFSFPTSKSKWDQRIKWINAVKRINVVGSEWIPTKSDKICSAHFVDNIKSNDPLSSSYVPIIFPEIYKRRKNNLLSIKNRYNRLANRRKMKASKFEEKNIVQQNLTNQFNEDSVEYQDFENMNTVECVETVSIELPIAECKTADHGCQAYFNDDESYDNTFTCNRYIYGSYSEAEIQTDINVPKKVIINCNKKQQVHKSCNTNIKSFVDQSINTENTYFQGFSSISNDEQLVDLAGTTLENFDILSKRLPECKFHKVDLRNRLLIFLIKLKTGLSYSALGVLFSVNRTTISNIFLSCLEYLTSATREFIFWPDKLTVLATMPNCFRLWYSMRTQES